jgi:hypothetical protein
MAKIIKLINGRATEVTPQEALKPASKTDRQRLEDHMAKRGDLEALKKSGRRR